MAVSVTKESQLSTAAGREPLFLDMPSSSYLFRLTSFRNQSLKTMPAAKPPTATSPMNHAVPKKLDIEANVIVSSPEESV